MNNTTTTTVVFVNPTEYWMALLTSGISYFNKNAYMSFARASCQQFYWHLEIL